MKFLYFLIVFYLLYQAFRVFVMPLIFNKVQKSLTDQLKNMMNQQANNNNNDHHQVEGETTITATKNTNKRYNNNGGDYIDFEEIK